MVGLLDRKEKKKKKKKKKWISIKSKLLAEDKFIRILHHKENSYVRKKRGRERMQIESSIWVEGKRVSCVCV